MQSDELLKIVLDELDERKGLQITSLDLREKSNFTDYMVVVTGTSNRHLMSMCEHVIDKVEEKGGHPLGLEGGPTADWVLLDLGDVIVQAMTAQARDHYQLEKLWSVDKPGEIEKQAG
jgi:ribosome-associated protein